VSRAERVADWAERWARVFGAEEAPGAGEVIAELVIELRRASRRGPAGRLLDALTARVRGRPDPETAKALAELEQALSRLRLEGDIDARVRDVLDGAVVRAYNSTHPERDVRQARNYLHTHVRWPLERALARLKGE
jgi:hypothetical protein